MDRVAAAIVGSGPRVAPGGHYALALGRAGEAIELDQRLVVAFRDFDEHRCGGIDLSFILPEDIARQCGGLCAALFVEQDMPHVEVISRARFQPCHGLGTLRRPTKPLLMFGVNVAEARIAIQVAEAGPAGALPKQVIQEAGDVAHRAPQNI